MQFQVFPGRVTARSDAYCDRSKEFHRHIHAVTSACLVLHQDWYALDQLLSLFILFWYVLIEKGRPHSSLCITLMLLWKHHLDIFQRGFACEAVAAISDEQSQLRPGWLPETISSTSDLYSDYYSACDACGSWFSFDSFSSRRELTAFQADVKAGPAILSFLCRCSDRTLSSPASKLCG